MDMYKPPVLVKKVYFRRLTFGDAPFKIDNVWIDRSDPTQVAMEVCPGLRRVCILHWLLLFVQGHIQTVLLSVATGLALRFVA